MIHAATHRAARCARRLPRWFLGLTLSLALSSVEYSLSAQGAPAVGPSPVPVQLAPGKPYTFVVLGHLRGDGKTNNPRVPELMEKVRAIKPAFIVVTGDAIWGEMGVNPSNKANLIRDWDYIDSTLATAGVPVYRVPGNHDISDIASRDVYRERYGVLPAAVEMGDTRVLLLQSPWTPSDTDHRKMPFARAKQLEASQFEFLKRELAKPGFAHTFVAMHDLFWWGDDSSHWFREVHPLLKQAKVDLVFSGDLGPLKFSTRERDGVRYFQSTIETTPQDELLRELASSRILSSQFDNFLEVNVDGPSVGVRVHTVAEVSSGMFTPDHFNSMNLPPASSQTPMRRAWKMIGTPKRVALIALVMLVAGSLVGYLAGRASTRRRS